MSAKMLIEILSYRIRDVYKLKNEPKFFHQLPSYEYKKNRVFLIVPIIQKEEHLKICLKQFISDYFTVRTHTWIRDN